MTKFDMHINSSRKNWSDSTSYFARLFLGDTPQWIVLPLCCSRKVPENCQVCHKNAICNVGNLKKAQKNHGERSNSPTSIHFLFQPKSTEKLRFFNEHQNGQIIHCVNSIKRVSRSHCAKTLRRSLTLWFHHSRMRRDFHQGN